MPQAEKPPHVLLLACGSVAAVLACTWLAFFLHLNLASAGFLLLVLIVLSAAYGGFAIGTLSSIAAVTCLNYFFVPPVFSFSVNHPENWVALGAFEFTALTISRLSHRARLRAAEALAERADTERLYQMAQRLLTLDRAAEPGTPIPAVIREVFGLSGVVLFDGTSAQAHSSGPLDARAEERTRGAYQRDTDDFDASSATWFCVLRLGSRPVGALGLAGGSLRPLATTAIASLAAVTLERFHAFDREYHAEAARRSEQLRTAVLEALAHEIKTPLTIIRTVSSGLLAAGGLSDTNRELMTLIDEQSSKLNDLATHLLGGGRANAAEFQPRCETLYLSELVTATVGAVCPGDARERFQFSIPQGEPWVLADRKMMGTAVAQLVDNALKYSEPASPIGIAVAAARREVIVTVQSHGEPIAPGDRERVFERFYRAEGAPNRPPGTGLGLSIVKRIVDAHQGRVWAESSAGGVSVFALALPAATPDRL